MGFAIWPILGVKMIKQLSTSIAETGGWRTCARIAAAREAT